jgi:hypothetical protein
VLSVRLREAARRFRGEEASTLALVPVAVVIVLGLAALALDAALLYLGQRRLADLAAATATDAAGVIEPGSFYGTSGAPHLDLAAAQDRAAALAASLGKDRSFEGVACEVAIESLTASATCRASVRPILAPFWPGLDDRLRLVVTESASALDEPPP